MMNEPSSREVKDAREEATARAVLVTIIISCAFIVLACIVSITVILSAFFMNPPW